jgi:hypothetical protein
VQQHIAQSQRRKTRRSSQLHYPADHPIYGAGIPNLLLIDVEDFPERRASASIEALTAYLPARFQSSTHMIRAPAG